MTSSTDVKRPGLPISPLMVRVLSASVFLLAVVGLIYAGTIGVSIIVVVLGGLALWEFRHLSDRMGFRAPSWLLFPMGAYLAFSGTLLKNIPIELVFSLALVFGLGGFLFVPGQRQGLGRWAMGLAGALYIGFPFNYYLVLYSGHNGLEWALFIVLAVVFADAAGLLVGSRLGKHPFFPAISPHKTVEGAIASFLAPILAWVLVGFGILGLALPHAIAIGALIGIGAVAGDLVESQLKRVAEVKDSSHLIPGHGGILDRIDSILFPPILVYFYATLMHLL